MAVNRAERRVIFGEAKWQPSSITQNDIDKLINSGLRWLDGDPYWDVHYVFFAREFGEIAESVSNQRRVYFYTAEDILKQV